MRTTVIVSQYEREISIAPKPLPFLSTTPNPSSFLDDGVSYQPSWGNQIISRVHRTHANTEGVGHGD